MNTRTFGTVLASLILLWAFAASAATNSPRPDGSMHGVDRMPASLAAALARVQARDASVNPKFAIDKDGCALLPGKRAEPRLSGCFSQHATAFSNRNQKVKLDFVAWGHEGAMHRVSQGRVQRRGNRVAFRGRGIAQWWRVLPMGFEQGFTIDKAPAGHGPVVLEMRTNVTPGLEHGSLRWGALRYGKLLVTDAKGRVLPSRMTVHGRRVLLRFDARHASFPVTVDPLVWIEQDILAYGGASYDVFGASIAISDDGKTALVGAPGRQVNANPGQGEVYVFTQVNGAWKQTATLIASDGAANDNFGISVAISQTGYRAVVGAKFKQVGGNAQQGEAYVFDGYTNGTWSQLAILKASDGASADYFGSSVAIANDSSTAVVGAPNKTINGNVNQGAVYVFDDTTTAGVWNQVARLTASDGAAYDDFGSHLAYAQFTPVILVGAMTKTVSGNTSEGAAYVFSDNTGTWLQSAELTAGDAATAGGYGYFGTGLALSADGNTAFVGAPGRKVGASPYQGSVYVFTQAGGTWSQADELFESDPVGQDHFGSSVALSADASRAIISADVKTVGGNSAQGAAYQFDSSGSSWQQTAEFTASDGAANDYFGNLGMSSDGSEIMIGAASHDTNGVPNQGKVYAYTQSNLSATISAPLIVQNAQTFTSQFSVTNNGATDSPYLTLLMTEPPANANFNFPVVPSQGSCSSNNTTKVTTCIVGIIPANGGQATLSMSLTSNGADGSVIAQSASVSNTVPALSSSAQTIISPTPPTVSGLSNLTVTSPTSGSEKFTISGTGTLTVDASSSNTGLLPNGNITGAGSCTTSGSCTLTLTPVSGKSGTSTVTVTVSDAYGESVSGSFVFTVKTRSASGSSGGGGALGPFTLLGLLLLALGNALPDRYRHHGSA